MISIDEKFLRERLSALRVERNISARELSLRLGQSENYINGIEIGKSMPSIKALFNICFELGVSVSDFFDEGNKYPLVLNEIIKESTHLDRQSLESVLAIMKNMR